MLINQIIKEVAPEHKGLEPTPENLHKILDYYHIPKEQRINVEYGSVLLPQPPGNPEVSKLLADLKDKKFLNKFLLAYSVGTENFGFGKDTKEPGVRIHFAKEPVDNITTTLYHITDVRNLSKIEKEGILPQKGSYTIGWTMTASYNSAIFLTDDYINLAKYMSGWQSLTDNGWKKNKMVLTIDVSGLKIHKDHNIDPDTKFKSYVTFDTIPPNRIIQAKKLSNTPNFKR